MIKYKGDLVFLFLFALMLNVFACENVRQNTLTRNIDRIFKDLSAKDGPGASVAVIRKGKIEYSRQYGSAQVEYDLPINENTIFHVASVSKQFAAMSVMLLAYDGKLDLDDEVQKYLPYVPKFNHPVTIRQMIQMTSGIRDQWELLAIGGWRLDDVITTEHVLQLIKRQKELNFEPNTQYLYSNMNYTLLGQIVEEVSGKTLAEFSSERIFGPLGMNSTHFHDDHEHIVDDRSYSYKEIEGTLKKSVLSYANVGATSLFTTANDLVKWLDNFRHRRVGGVELLDEMLTQGILKNQEKIAYAHGVVIGDYKGLKTVSHGGADAGFRSHVVWFPDKEVGIVVLTNLASAGPSGRVYKIADLLFEKEFSQYSEAANRNEPETIVVDDKILNSIIGRYQIDSDVEVELYKRWSSVYAKFENGDPVRLTPVGESKFWAKDLKKIIEFKIGNNSSDNYFIIVNEDGLESGKGVQMDPFTVSDSELKQLKGKYYSPELEALYTISPQSNGLIASHIRHGEIELKPIFKNQYMGDKWFFSSLSIQKEDDIVTGFILNGGRVKNLKFIKLDKPLPDLPIISEASSIPEYPFPLPTGEYGIGMKEYFWTDKSREETFTKNKHDFRNVNVRVWYPTDINTGQKAKYITNQNEFGSNTEFNMVQHVKTNALNNAQPLKKIKPFPVLIYNHGGSWTRFTSTFTTEELASHGYVVFSIGHNGFNKTQFLPDGTSVLMDTLSLPEPTGDFKKDAIKFWEYLDEFHFPQWVADIRFVIEKTITLNNNGHFKNILDLDNIGLYGWSFGGAASIQTAIDDKRVKAAIDHDGQLFGKADQEIITTPFMLFHAGDVPEAPKGKNDEETENNKRIMDELIEIVETKDAQLKEKSTNDWYDITIDGANHGHFSDLVLFYPNYAGDLPAKRAYKIINALTVSFFDHYLKQSPSDLLGNPVSNFSEVQMIKKLIND